MEVQEKKTHKGCFWHCPSKDCPGQAWTSNISVLLARPSIPKGQVDA